MHRKTSYRWHWTFAALLTFLLWIGCGQLVRADSAEPSPVCNASVCTVTFEYSGAPYVWQSPANATRLRFDLVGGQGGQGARTIGLGGFGGRVSGEFVDMPSTLLVYVGDRGSRGSGAEGAFNGGADAGAGHGDEGSGGGATDLRTSTSIEDRLVVAGGGGGSGGFNWDSAGLGGSGGSLLGGSGGRGQASPGLGGGQFFGGSAGQSNGGANGGSGERGYGGSGASSRFAGGGGGGGSPAPVITPNAPVITLIAGKEVCANGVTLVIEGRYLSGATVTFDGTPARVTSSSDTQLLVELPAGGIGTKTLKVFNADGSAATSIRYVLVDSPVYYNFLYPETYKDSPFTYTFAATNAYGYAIEGTLPNGLWLNEATGEIYGTPTKEGNYLFTLIALNPCGNSYLDVFMFVDAPIPPNYTCNVNFNVPSSNTITAAKIEALKNCLGRILITRPTTIDPVIFLSGGVPLGSTIDQMIAHPRYKQIVDIIDSMNIVAQIYLGAFAGPVDQVQVMIYWPVMLDV